MYYSQHRFTPAPDKLDIWTPYNRINLIITSRAEGAVLSRIMQINAHPAEYFAVGVWVDHDSAMRWTDGPVAKLALQPAIDHKLYDGYPMTWTRAALIDFAWGPRGDQALVSPVAVDRDPPHNTGESTTSVWHLTWPMTSETAAAQEQLSHAVLSAFTRADGFVAGEVHRQHRDESLIMLYTFDRGAPWQFGPSPVLPADVQLVLESDRARQLIRGLAAPEVYECTPFDSVWGPNRSALQAFAG